jgi:hypothetical protein
MTSFDFPPIDKTASIKYNNICNIYSVQSKGDINMAFLDKLGKKLGDVADTAADKAKDFAETTKLNSEISAEEKQITQYLLEIGKKIFEQEKDNPDSPFAELCGKIAVSQKAIEDLKLKIEEIKKN